MRPGGRLEVLQVPEPVAEPDEMVIRTVCAGLCGSDLYKMRNNTVAPGTVLGHEIVGVVEKPPQGFWDMFPPGTRVTVSNHVPCGTCPRCLRGRISSCTVFRSTNVRPGGFAERIVVPSSHLPEGVIPFSDSLSDSQALLAEPLGCCLRALERWEPSPRGRVMVIGLGPMGLIMSLVLARQGVEVVGVDLLEERRAAATQKGCTLTCAPSEAKDQDGFQGVVLTACNGAALELALKVVEPGGWIGLFAGPSRGEPLELKLQELYKEEVDLLPSYSTGPHHMRKAISLLEAKLLDVEGIISHELPIEEIEQAVQLAENKVGFKAMLRF